MTKQMAKKLKEKGYEFAAVDQETAKRIKKIAETTDSLPSEVINSAIQVLETAIGREVIVKDETEYKLTIDLYKKFKKIVPFL